MLDLDFVRSHFPTLKLAKPWALFDNAGGSAPTGGVIDAVSEFMRRWPVQLGASYELSAEATARLAAGHDAMALWTGVPRGSIVLGPSTTRHLQLLATALRPLWRRGDEVVVTNLDHEANIGPWRRLAETGIVVKEWRLRPESAALELADLEPLLGKRTRLVAFTQCSNIVGEIFDVAGAVRMIHAAGALACVDGVAYAAHRLLEVAAWDVDFYTVSLYKTFGPHLALLYGKRELLLAARGQYHFFHSEDDVPYKLEPGNATHELAASLPRITDYLDALAEHHFGPAAAGGDEEERRRRWTRVYDLIRDHEASLAGRLIDYLKSKKNVRLFGPATADGRRRVPTLTFTVAGRRSSEIPPFLDARHVAVRWGDFYSRRAIAALGLLEQDGVVRVSMVSYNTHDEVDRLIRALDEML